MFAIDYSIHMDIAPESEKIKYSTANHYLGFYGDFRPTKKLTLSGSILAHYAGKDLSSKEDYKNLYFDAFASFSLFYDVNEAVSPYLILKGGYYKDLIKDPDGEIPKNSDDIDEYESMMFLTGPSVSIEGGSYFYPLKDMNMIKIGGGVEFNFFSKINIDYRPDYEELADNSDVVDLEQFYLINRQLIVQNRYMNIFAKLETTWHAGKYFEFPIRTMYQFSYWIDKDEHYRWYYEGHGFDDVKIVKRRTEHTVSGFAEVVYKPLKKLRISIFGNISRNFSNIGDEADDYTDYDLVDYSAGLKIGYSF